MQITLDLSVGDEVYRVSPCGTYIERYIIRSISASVNGRNEVKVSYRAQYYNEIMRRTVVDGINFSQKDIGNKVFTKVGFAIKEAEKRQGIIKY